MFAPFLLLATCLSALLLLCAAQEPIRIGDLTTIDHDVSGTVFAINDRTLEIQNFVYDGKGPAAVYWIDRGNAATSDGLIAPEAESCDVISRLPRFSDQTVRIELPNDLTLSDVGHFSIWCEQAGFSFGGIDIDVGSLSPTPPEAEPRCVSDSAQPEQKILIGELSTLEHDVSGTVYAINERTLQIENFNYDGRGPAAAYWIDRGTQPTTEGLIAPVLDSCEPINRLGEHRDETVRIELPDGLTLSEVGYFSIWCIRAGSSFGGIEIDVDSLTETPARADAQCGSDGDSAREEVFPVQEGYNCESLSPTYQVRWQLDSDNELVRIELVASLDDTFYMGFGVSGSDTSTQMVGSDVAIAFMQGNKSRAVDYHMSSRDFCNKGEGVCPDVVRDPENGEDHIGNVDGKTEGKVIRITYTRPIAAMDAGLDSPIRTDGPTFISWATGPLDAETMQPTFHGNMRNVRIPQGDVQIDFTREVENRCDPLEIEEEEEMAEPFERPVFSNITEFTARIGPSGGERGVAALRDSSWGIAWYMSPTGSEGQDVLIPAIGVERGKTYRFTVYGGDSGPSFHPLYITSSDRGGYLQLTPSSRLNETVYAGINFTSRNESGVFEFDATAAGTLCELETNLNGTAGVETYQDFYNSLDTSCTQNETITRNGGELEWTVALDTPDVVYYQCVTHPLLGFEILVFDEGQVDVEQLRFASAGRPIDTNTICTVTVDNEELTFAACSEIDPSSEYTVYWNVKDDEIETLIRARSDGYVGFGWGYNMMVPGNAAVVYKTADDSAEISDYQLSAQTPAGVQPNSNQGLTDTAAFVDGDFVIGRFTRKLSITGLPELPSEGEVSVIWSIGARPDSPTTLEQHSTEGVATIDLSRGSATTIETGPSAFFVVHGVFMGLSWLLFVPTAIITMRFFKKYNPVAFQIHRALNGTSVVLVIVAYFMGISRGNRVERAHLIIGSIVFCLAVLQGLGGLFRPSKGTPARRPWYLGHSVLGITAWGLGAANVFLGIAAITNRGSGARAWYAVAGVAVGIAVDLMVMLSCFPNLFPTRVDDDVSDGEEKVHIAPNNARQAGVEDSRI